MKLSDVVQHFLSDCRIRGRTQGTLVSYTQRLGVLVQVLATLCGVTELEQVTVFHLRRCVEYMMSPEFPSLGGAARETGVLALTTLKGYILVFKAFFHWCYQEELISQDVVARLRIPKVPEKVTRTLEPSHIEVMLQSCDTKTDMGFRDYAILLLLFDAGLRRSEAATLRVEDIHETYVKVYGKGRKEREVGIHPETAKVLWKYIHKYRHPKDSNEQGLFLSYWRDRPLASSGIWEVVRRAKEAAGLGDMKITPHMFRHTFARLYLESGGEIFNLSREMGHSYVQVTEKYLKHFTSKQARKQHTTFSPVQTLHLRKGRGSRRRKTV